MIDFSPEIETLRQSGALTDARAASLIARQKREVFSVYPELRLTLWLGVMLIVTGAGILVARNVEKIGPLALALAIAAASAGCYGYAIWHRRLARSSVIDDFVLLLGALLLSVDLGYVESQFHLLDYGWPRHFLILAILHGVTAYFFDSRTLLCLSLAALAGWMGIEQRVETLFESTAETSIRALICSGCVLLWRAIDARSRASRTFEPVFEHFAANLALFGALSLTFDHSTRWVGTLLTIAIAAGVILHGFRSRSESFVIYSYVYAVIAIDVFIVAELIQEDVALLSYLILSTIAAITGLFLLHSRFRGPS